MSTKMRLMRMGSMKRPFYRIVVVDSRKRRDGRYIENVGTYNPIPKDTEITLKEERILHWLGEGVILSGTVENMVRQAGIMEKFQLMKSGVSAEELETKLAEWKAKQPKALEGTLSRTEKKAKKKDDARAAAAAEVAEAEKAAAAEAAAAEKAAAAEAKKAADAAAAEAKDAAEAAPEESAEG